MPKFPVSEITRRVILMSTPELVAWLENHPKGLGNSKFYGKFARDLKFQSTHADDE